MIRHLFNRLSEPSSYAGLMGILLLVGIKVDPGMLQEIVTAIAGVSGFISFLMKEKGE